MNEGQDAREQQALIDDIIHNLTGGEPTDMRIAVDLDADIICVAPPESSGVVTDFAYAVDCAGACGMTFSLSMRRDDYERWRSRTAVIQQCFQYITPPFRELLVSGLCPACWRGMFGASTDDDDGAARPETSHDAAEGAPLKREESRRQTLNRTVFLRKGERLGLLHVSRDERGIRVVSYEPGEPNRPLPSARLFDDTPANLATAQAEFWQALETSASRGWTIGYDGPPLFG